MAFITQGKTNRKFLLIIVVLAAIVGGGILVYQNWCPKEKEAQSPEIKIPEKTKDETADWETYVNNELGYSIKYSSDFRVDELAGGLSPVIYKGEKLNLTPPNDPYRTALGVNDRSAWGKSGQEACWQEICRGAENPVVGKNYKIEEVKINNTSGVKITNVETPLLADYYLGSPDGKRVVRITLWVFKYGADDTRTDQQLLADFNELGKIISTFKFIGPEKAPTREESCVSSGGTVSTSLCCESASDFPNLCLIGPCGCGPQNSHQIKTCDCGPGECFNGTECVNFQNP